MNFVPQFTYISTKLCRLISRVSDQRGPTRNVLYTQAVDHKQNHNFLLSIIQEVELAYARGPFH